MIQVVAKLACYVNKRCYQKVFVWSPLIERMFVAYVCYCWSLSADNAQSFVKTIQKMLTERRSEVGR
jgi:hypothetical protein